MVLSVAMWTLLVAVSAHTDDAPMQRVLAEIRREASVTVDLRPLPSDGGTAFNLVVGDPVDAARTYSFPIASAAPRSTATGVEWSCEKAACVVACRKDPRERPEVRCEPAVRTVNVPARRSAVVLSTLFGTLKALVAPR